MLERFPAISEDRLSKMESFWKELRRTSKIELGRWENAEKISGDLRTSARKDGKFLGRFQTIF